MRTFSAGNVLFEGRAGRSYFTADRARISPAADDEITDLAAVRCDIRIFYRFFIASSADNFSAHFGSTANIYVACLYFTLYAPSAVYFSFYFAAA